MKNTLIKTLFITLSVSLFACQTNTNSEPITVELTEMDDSTSVNTLVGVGNLDLKVGFENEYYLQSSDSEYVFMYLSFTAAEKENSSKRSPLNISVVIDRSGSMHAAGKLEYVKEASELIVDNLHQNDKISIVTYDNITDILYRSNNIISKNDLKNKIKGLTPRGGTNLSSGMLEGYAQAKSTYSNQNVNRVLLLSDGLANQGIVSPAELQRIVNSKFENDAIAISTFGVGADYDEDLLTNLAEYGKGNYYYIDSPDKIPEIFTEELHGLLSVVMQNTSLKVNFPNEYFTIEDVFGYEYTTANNIIEVKLNDVFAGEEKAILIKFKRKKVFEEDLTFTATLTYDDVNADYERKELIEDLILKVTTNQSTYNNSFNEDVLRNKIVFLSNDILEKATAEVDKGNYDEARLLLNSNTLYLEQEFDNVAPDSNMTKQLENNKFYLQEVNTIEEKSVYERKMMQKSAKNYNYRVRKKK